MAITYKSQGSGVATESSGAALSPLCPATVDAGDILIAHVMWEGTTTAPATPSGWALLRGPDDIGVTVVARHWVFGRIADGSEDGAAVAFGAPAVTTQRGARVYSFAGRVSGAITDLVNGFAATAHDTDPQMPSVTTTATGALAVALVAQNDNNATASATGESGGDWVEAVAEFTANLTPGLGLSIQTATPTGNPGTISGGSISTTNDPAGVVAFQIRDQLPALVMTGAVTLPMVVAVGAMQGPARFTLSASTHIGASGEATTAQLTAPAGKTTADFQAGRIQDDENPADSVDLAADKYTELEWSAVATEDSLLDDYEFRVTAAGVVLDTYTETPVITVAPSATLLDGAVTLPMVTAAGTATVAISATGAGTIPMVVASGTVKVEAQATGAATIPMIQAAGTIGVDAGLVGAASVPMIQAAGTVANAITATGAASLPMVQATGTIATDIALVGAATLPMIVAAGVAKVDVTAAGAATLPMVVAAGTMMLEQAEAELTGAVVLPMVTASGTAEVAAGVIQLDGAATLPMITAAGSVAVTDNPTLTGAVVLPMLTASGTATVAIQAAGAAVLPMVMADGDIQVAAFVGAEITGAISLPMIVASGLIRHTIRYPIVPVFAGSLTSIVPRGTSTRAAVRASRTTVRTPA